LQLFEISVFFISIFHLRLYNCVKYVCFLVFNATFNNISVVSRRSVLLVEKIGGLRENHYPVTSLWQTLSHNVVHLALVIGTDCIGSCKSNYHAITATLIFIFLYRTTVTYIEKSLPENSKSPWQQRGNVDHIIIMDWTSKLKDCNIGTMIRTLKDALFKVRSMCYTYIYTCKVYNQCLCKEPDPGQNISLSKNLGRFKLPLKFFIFIHNFYFTEIHIIQVNWNSARYK
jgi:hypothetical protein